MALIDGHLLCGKSGDMIFGNKGTILYSTQRIRLAVMTEWQFDQTAYGDAKNFPQPFAYINGVCVCPHHATTHIIDYYVTEDQDPETHYNPYTKQYEFEWTMTILVRGAPGGPCVYRCWDKEYENYGSCPEDLRASVSGDQNTVAHFKAVYSESKSKWKFSSY